MLVCFGFFGIVLSLSLFCISYGRRVENLNHPYLAYCVIPNILPIFIVLFKEINATLNL